MTLAPARWARSSRLFHSTLLKPPGWMLTSFIGIRGEAVLTFAGRTDAEPPRVSPRERAAPGWALTLVPLAALRSPAVARRGKANTRITAARTTTGKARRIVAPNDVSPPTPGGELRTAI